MTVDVVVVVVVAGYFHACEDFWGALRNPQIIHDESFTSCDFFFKVDISSRVLVPLFRPGSVYSGSAT